MSQTLGCKQSNKGGKRSSELQMAYHKRNENIKESGIAQVRTSWL